MRRAWMFVVPFLLASSVAAAAPRRAKAAAKARSGKHARSEQARSTHAREADRTRDDVVADEPDGERSHKRDEVATDEPAEDPPAPDAVVGEADVVVHEARPRRRHRVANELYVEAGMAYIDPSIASGGLTLQPEGIARLATPMGPIDGGIGSGPSTMIAGIIGFAPAALRGYVAVETIVGVPKKTKLRAHGDLATKSLAPTALDLVPTGIPPLGEEIGEASAVPPMLTVLGRSPWLGPVRLYAGGGASILFITDAKITNPVLTEVATPKLEIDPAFGVVAQAGIDVHLFDRFFARLDIKQLWFESSESRITNIHVRTTIPLLETVNVGSATSEINTRVRIVHVGIGAKF